MKSTLSLCIVLLVSYACQAQDKTAKPAPVKYAYPIQYSAEFVPIDPQKGKMVTERWKEFDANELDKWKTHFADTVVMLFQDNTLRGSRDNILGRVQAYRGKYQTVERQVDVVISTRSMDKNQDFVLIWGKEKGTDLNGKPFVLDIHEIWEFATDGRISMIEQYIRK